MAVHSPARLTSEIQRGESLRKAGDFRGAAQHFGRVVEAFEAGRLAPADGEAIVQAYLGWARSWLAVDDYDRAIKALDRVASLFSDPDVHARRGILLEDLNRDDEAVEEYRRVEPALREV